MENNELELRITTKLDDIDYKINKITNSLNQGGKSAEYFGKAFNFNNIISGLTNVSNLSRKLSGFFKDGIDKINDYSETLNLFNLVMGDNLKEQANNFQNSMLNAFQNFSTDQLKMQSMFQSMTESLGLTEDYAYIISENMTKLSYDLASLYNTSQSRASQALQSALVGQTRPVRSYGMDVTQNTISTTLSGIGITDRTVTQLSQVEKELLRYISLLKQSSLSHGDFANTIESPSNQLKILGNQIKEVGKWFGAVFINTFAKALPYINAVVMAIKEVLKALAYLVGYTGEDYNAGLSTYNTDYVDYLDDVGASADSTKGKIKELKREVLGFDQINNINEDTDNSSGTGIGAGSGIGGIDQRLLDALTGYDNLMDKVNLKANQIKEKLMKWLGLVDKNKDGIYEFEKGLTRIKVIAGLLGGVLLAKIVKSVSSIGKLLGGAKILKGVKDFVEYLRIGVAVTDGKLLSGIKAGTDAWLSQLGVITRLGIGLTGLVATSYISYESMQKLAEGTMSAGSAFGTLALSTAGAVASGAMIGSIFGPVGTTIGAVAGAVIELTSALVGYVDKANEVKVTEDLFDHQGIKIQELIGHYQSLFSESTKYTGALDELKEKYESAQEKVTSAKNELDNFKASLDLQSEAITQSQLDQLKEKFENLKVATIEAKNVSTEYAIALIKAYGQTSEESKIATAQQIADIKKLALAQEEKDTEYIKRMEDLEIKYQTGEISLADYKRGMEDLNLYFGYTSEVTLDAAGAIEHFNEKINDIDYNVDDAKQLKETISGVSEEYNKTVETLENEKDRIKDVWQPQIDGAQKVVDNYDEIMRKGGTLSEEQQKWYEEAKATVETYTDNMNSEIETVDSTIQTIQGSYKGFISGVYADLVSNGADTNKAFKSVLSTIESDLDELKNVDMSGFGEGLFNSMIDSISTSENSYLPTLKSKFDRYGIDAGESFHSAYYDSLSDAVKQENIRKASATNGFKTVEGYRFGINSEINRSGAGGKELGEQSIDETRTALDSHSPSRVYESIGIDTVQGYIDGINEKKKSLLDTINILLNEIKKKFENVKFSINISNNVESSFNSILSKLEIFANKFRSGINSILSKMTTSMNSVFVGGDNRIYYNSMPYISVPRFANGGMPEDGLFYANHSELVGKFSNGKTAVANNNQITQGIKEAVLEALNTSSFGGSQSVKLDIRQDEGIVVKVIDGINTITKTTGESPIDIW